MSYRLFIDDMRNPASGDWIIVRSYEQACKIVMQLGFPIMISFDHDLGIGNNGFDFAKFLVNWDLDAGVMPTDFTFEVHSKNPIGKQNIEHYLNDYLFWKKHGTGRK